MTGHLKKKKKILTFAGLSQSEPASEMLNVKTCKKNSGHKEMFPDFGLPCSSLYSVKQQTTVICTDRLCLSNGTAESHTEPQGREREGKREREGAEEGD